MSTVYQLLNFLFQLCLAALFILLFYFVLKTFLILVRSRSARRHSFKIHFKHFLWHVRDTRYIKIVEFIKWVIIDTMRGKDRLRLFGIWAFTGYYGEGKTLGCVTFAKQLQKDYPHRNIKIFSNIQVKGQVKRLESWEEILTLPKHSIVIYDESQADYSCNMKEFPEDFLRRITQCRKKQLALFMTSPRYNRMNINIRESVNFVIECKNLLQMDRWFKYVFYHAEDYDQYRENKIKLMLHKYLTYSFVTQDRDYKNYNTVEEVGSIKPNDVKVTKKDAVNIDMVLKVFRNQIIKEVEEKLKKIA